MSSLEQIPRSSAYFGEDLQASVWPIERERIQILGRSARLMAEVSHPLVACAILANTDFTFEQLNRRLKTNVSIIFGTVEEARQSAQAVNHAHQMKAENPVGSKFNVHDPELMGFVFMMRQVLSLNIHQKLVSNLSGSELDNYVSGINAYGRMFGISKRYKFNNHSDLKAEYHRALTDGRIAIIPQTLEIKNKMSHPFSNSEDAAKFLLGYLSLPWVKKELAIPVLKLFELPLNTLSTTIGNGLLTPELREGYAIPWGRSEQAILDLFASSIKTANHLLPKQVRFFDEYRRYQ